jgi:mono/diheme cytochrome c family protein
MLTAYHVKRARGFCAAVYVVPLAAGLVACLLALALPARSADAQDDEEALTNPHLGDPEAIDAGERIFRRRCTGCHWSPLRAPVLFHTKLSDESFLETVINGRKGRRGNMPPFGYVLSPDDVWNVHAFVMAKDGL